MTLKNPYLSIIIVSYNVYEYLSKCIASIIRSTDIDYEIIVVDNNSSDNTPNRLQTAFPLVNVICNKENIGFAKANNVGVQKATGDILLFLNPDTEINSTVLKDLSFALLSHESIGIVGPQLLNTDGSKQHSYGALPSAVISKKIASQGGFSLVGYIKGACLMIRRNLFERLNGFDEDFFMYSEERDLALRVWNAGMMVSMVPEVTVTHHGEKSSSNYSFASHKMLHKSKLLFIIKHLKGLNACVEYLKLVLPVLGLWLHACVNCPGKKIDKYSIGQRRSLFWSLLLWHLKVLFNKFNVKEVK